MIYWVDWRTLPSIVRCHRCDAVRNNYEPRDADGNPDYGIGWYSNARDRLIWCDRCWLAEGFKRYFA